MNKSTGKSEKVRKKANNEKVDVKDDKTEEIIAKLLENAKHSLYSYEFDLAQKFCQRALEKDSSNIEALDLLGSIYTEMGDIENAKKSLQLSIELDGKGSYVRYMSMGQLSVGGEAVELYRKGIKAIQDTISLQRLKDTKSDTSVCMKDLSAAYLQLAEIYLTDECSSTEAEELCKTYLQQSLEADPSNVQAYHTFASYHVSLQNHPMAKEMMDKGLEMWLPRLREIHQSETISMEDENMLDVASRINCCKTLIELAEYDKAFEILELLLDENEQLVEVWYLLGWLNCLKGDGYEGNVKSYMKKALELAIETEFEDAAMVEHIKEILENNVNEDDEDVDDLEEMGDDEDEEKADDLNEKDDSSGDEGMQE